MKKIQILLLVILTSTTFPVFGDDRLPDAFYTFGDSLADNGNDLQLTRFLLQDPETPPSSSPHRTYYNGRFSNGPIAFEYLWAGITGQEIGAGHGVTPFLSLSSMDTKGAVNFAFGGSRTGYLDPIPGGSLLLPGLRAQVELFRRALHGRPPSRRALYGIATGANEYLVTPPGTPADPQVVVQNIAAAIGSLYEIGARDLIVYTLPDLGQLPIVANDPAAQAGLSYLSSVHNELLRSRLSALEVQLPGLTITTVDVNAFLAALPASFDRHVPALDAMFPPPAPGEYPMSMCLFTNTQNCLDAPTFDVGANFLFWDAEHPTTAVHKRLGEQLYAGMIQ